MEESYKAYIKNTAHLFDFSFVICKQLKEKEGRQGRKGERKRGSRRRGQGRGDLGSKRERNKELEGEISLPENELPAYHCRNLHFLLVYLQIGC